MILTERRAEVRAQAAAALATFRAAGRLIAPCPTRFAVETPNAARWS